MSEHCPFCCPHSQVICFDVDTMLKLIAPLLSQPDGTRVPEGLTVAQIVAATLPGLTAANMDRCRVALVTQHGTAMILRADWHRVRPKPGVRVVIRLIPGEDPSCPSLSQSPPSRPARSLVRCWRAFWASATPLALRW